MEEAQRLIPRTVGREMQVFGKKGFDLVAEKSKPLICG